VPTLNIGGQRVTVGDEFLKLSPEQQNETVEEIAKSLKTKPSMNAGDVAEDVAKSAGIGVVKGGIATAGALGDVRNLASAGAGHVWDKMGVSPETQQQIKGAAATVSKMLPGGTMFNLAPDSGQIREKVEGVTGKLYEPKSVPGQYAQTVGEFLPAAASGPAGIVRRGAQVVIPALVSETAGQLTKGSAAEPAARFAGALAGGIGAGLAARPGTAARAIRESLPEGVTPQMVDDAERLIGDAAQRGIQLAWPEALSQVAGRPILTDTMRHLEASPQTAARMGEFFAGRPQQVEQAARQQFDQIAPPNANPSTIGRDVGRAAEAEVTQTRQAINQQAQPHYRASENVLLTPTEMARVRAIPGFEEARAAVRDNPQLNRYVAHLPDESVGFLNEVKKQLDRAGENAVGPFNQQPNQQVAAGYAADARRVRRTAQAIDARYGQGDYSQALAIERQGREQILQPLLDGYIGKLANRDQTTQQAIAVLFPKNPLPNSQDEIAAAVGALANRNQRAASDLVRAHAESTFNEATRALQAGANPKGGANFRAQVVGNPQQAANLEAAVTALPNGQQRWDGFNRFLDIMEAVGNRPNVGSRTAYNQEINKMGAMGGVSRDAAKVGLNPLKALQPAIERYDQWKLGRNLNQLAGILTDPGAANQLRAIARMPQGNAATSAALKLLTYAGASTP
jgi:hypothetical protein